MDILIRKEKAVTAATIKCQGKQREMNNRETGEGIPCICCDVYVGNSEMSGGKKVEMPFSAMCLYLTTQP